MGCDTGAEAEGMPHATGARCLEELSVMNRCSYGLTVALCRDEKPIPLTSIAMIAMTPAVILTTLEFGSRLLLGVEQQQKKPAIALLL